MARRSQTPPGSPTTTPNDTRHFRRYERWSDFIEHARQPTANASRMQTAYCSWSVADDSKSRMFYGTVSPDAAHKLVDRGWSDGTARVMQMRAELDGIVQAASVAKARTQGWSQSGEWLHIGRAIQGRPDCFARSFDSHDDVAGRVITVVQNASCSSAVQEATIFKRGAITLCLVDVLETLGHRVELLYGACAERSDALGAYDEWHAVAKTPGEHLDVDRLSFFFCHRSGLRRYGFAAYEHLGRVGNGYPKPMQMTINANPGCIMIPEVGAWTEPKDAIMQCMRSAGITIDFDSN